MSRRTLVLPLLLAGGLLSAAPVAAQDPAGLSYHLVPRPCRLVDTRCSPTTCSGVIPTQANGAPALQNGSVRTFHVQGFCGVPVGAKAVAVNVTVSRWTADGHLTVHPADQPVPLASTINFGHGYPPALASHTDVVLAPAAPELAVFTFMGSNPAAEVHLIIDVYGYFQ